MKIKLAVIITCIASCFFSMITHADSSNNPKIVIGNYISTVRNKFTPFIGISKNANSWSYPETIRTTFPEDNNWDVYLSGTDCNSKMCTAVGYYSNNETDIDKPLLAISTDHGITWSYTPTIANLHFHSAELNATHCFSDICVVTGNLNKDDSNDVNIPFVAVSHDNTWSVPTSLNDQLPNDYKTGAVSGLSCHDTFCVAAGDYDTNNGYRVPFVVMSEDADKMIWTWSPTIRTNMPAGYDNVMENNVSCNNETCIVTGSLYGKNKKLPLLAISHHKGKIWSYPADIINNLPADFHDEGSFTESSCSGNLCMAAGYYKKNDSNHTIMSLIAVSQDAGNTWHYWSGNIAGLPDGYAKQHLMSHVHCNQSICLASGEGYSTLGYTHSLLLISRDSGASWSFVKDLQENHKDTSIINNIHCDKNSCMILGEYQNAGLKPLLMTTEDNGITWTFPSTITSELPQDFREGGFYKAFNPI